MSKYHKRSRYKRKRSSKSFLMGLNVMVIALTVLIFALKELSIHSLASPNLQTIKLPQEFWYVIISWFGLQALILLFYFWMKRLERNKAKHRLRVSGIGKIDHMSGQEFEDYLTVYFEDLGYKVEDTGRKGDRGADKILKEPGTGKRICVQAKCWNKNVTFDAVQQVYTAKKLWNCEEAWIITNRNFTKQVRETAAQLEIDLWDREKLTSKMYAYNHTKIGQEIAAAYYAAESSNVFHDQSCEHGRNLMDRKETLMYSNYKDAVNSGRKKCSCYK